LPGETRVTPDASVTMQQCMLGWAEDGMRVRSVVTDWKPPPVQDGLGTMTRTGGFDQTNRSAMAGSRSRPLPCRPFRTTSRLLSAGSRCGLTGSATSLPQALLADARFRHLSGRGLPGRFSAFPRHRVARKPEQEANDDPLTAVFPCLCPSLSPQCCAGSPSPSSSLFFHSCDA